MVNVSSALMMEVEFWSETLVTINHIILCHIPESYNMNLHCHENLKSHSVHRT
jgi:hypothetical protein